jgi:hypothetical protein
MDYETTFRGQIVTLSGSRSDDGHVMESVYLDGTDVTGIVHPDDWEPLQADYEEHMLALDREDRDTRQMKRLGER